MNIGPRPKLKYWTWGPILFLLLWAILYLKIAPEPQALFIQNWPFIFVGLGAAILGNISAVGGGIIFIPAMIFAFHLPPVVALKVAILSQCFGMTSGALTWIQRQTIPPSILLICVPSLLLGSTLSSLVIHPSPLLVKLFFGPVSIILGILTLLSTRNKNLTQDSSALININPTQKLKLALVSILGGLITGWVAIGEGELVSAFLILVLKVNVALSIAIGVVLLAINSLYLGVIHQFFLNGLPWEIAAFTGLGCVFGARLAPFIAAKLNPKTLKYIFSFIAIGDGLLFIYQYIK